MAKYIDADLLRKDINRWKEAMADAVGEYSDGVRFALEHFTFVLDSLQQEQGLIIINKKDWEAQEQFRKNKDFGKPLQKEQDYSDLSDLERAIHRGFLCAGVENVPVAIIKETAKEAMADLERTFECNPDKLPIWLKNGLAKKHLEGYIMGREDTMREMKDFIESHFNCEKAREGTYYKDYERSPEPIPTGIPYQSPQCGTNVTIVPNINSGTSTSKAEG